MHYSEMKRFFLIAVLGCLGALAKAEVPSAIFPELPTDVVQVYPNPFQDEITIDVSKASKIKIVNLIGEVVYETKEMEANSQLRINLNELPKGIYFLNVSVGKESITKKLIKR